MRGFQRVREGSSLIGHARQDVVAGAVDDAPNGIDSVGRKRLPNHANHGNGASHRSLEVQLAAIGLGEREQCPASLGEKRLVGRDHVLLRIERRSHQPIGNFDPADELDDDIDVVSGNDFKRVVHEGNARILRPHDGEPSRVLISHRRELYGCTSSRGDDVGVLQQGRHEAFPDHPATT